MRKKTKFECGDFSCDVAIYKNGKDIVVRFYDKEAEHTEEEICNYVVVAAGYGYLCLHLKGEMAGLLSGFLVGEIFTTNAMMSSAIEFVLNLIPDAHNRYIPYNVHKIEKTGYVQYNGEI